MAARPTADSADSLRVSGNTHAEWIAVGDLVVDRTYQRDLRERLVAHIVENFDPNLIGTIEVSLRPTGAYRIIDGQHRIEAMRRLGMLDRLVLCNVRVQTSTAEEADLFWKVNQHRKPLTSWDLYRAKLVSKEPTALDLDAKLRTLGIAVTPSGAGKTGGLLAIGTAMTLHGREYDFDTATPLFLRTLGSLRDAWSEHVGCFDETLLRGMALFLGQHEHYVEHDRLVTQLQRTYPSQILHDARALKKSSQWALSSFIALTIEAAYNFQRSRGRLHDTAVSTYAMALREYERRHRGGDE